jgi:adenylosuccinate synthase
VASEDAVAVADRGEAMSVTVVVGGQYGSEGKGKLVSYLACHSDDALSVVRCGGPNAGHTAVGNGLSYQLRQLPSGVVDPRAGLFMAAGMIIDLPVLLSEIETCGVGPDRLMIDRNACLVDDVDRAAEVEGSLRDRIGSTLSGTGSATARKVLRDPKLPLARQIPELAPYIGDVAESLNCELDQGKEVLVEGTQGFGLSLHHSDVYPFATSRDTTAGAFLSEAGLSPLMVTDIYVVLRTFPIRVAGNSGDLFDEIRWADVQSGAGYPHTIAEYTTVTKKLRRVGRFDWQLAERAIAVNRPTGLALHGADYLDYDDYGKSDWNDLSPKSRGFVEELEMRLGVPVAFVFTGPDASQIVDRRSAKTRSAELVRVAAV